MAWNSRSSTVVGYLAALIGCLAFGSFAVPIKNRASLHVPVDPLVLQSYKVAMCFVTSLPVLVLVPTASWSPWGLVSGLFMVPGGAAGYLAVRHAGLTVSQGIWSCAKVLVACAWGWLAFGEEVRHPALAIAAVTLLLVGLAGTSVLAAPAHHRPPRLLRNEPEVAEEALEEPLLPVGEPSDDPTSDASTDEEQRGGWNRRPFMGLACAAVDGLYGGSVLVPMHYARPTSSRLEDEEALDGMAFLFSFATGCFAVLLTAWCLRWLWLSLRARSLSKGWRQLPSFHATTRVGRDAALAGLIWSVGNAASLVSVAALGQGLGYSIVQSQLLVAGLWGIIWYREVTGIRIIAQWLFFAALTVTGIVLLAQERIPLSKCHG